MKIPGQLALEINGVKKDERRENGTLRTGSSRREVIRFWLVWASLAVLYAIHTLRYIHVNLDDQYILYKYSVNLALGHGFAYNPGVPMEGFSTFLYVVIMAGFFWLAGATGSSADTVVLMTVLGKGFNFICTLGTLAYLVWLLRGVLKLRPLGVFIALLPLVAGPDFAYSSTNGLETGLVIFAYTGLATHFLLFAESNLTDRSHLHRGLAWVAVLIVTRADGILLSGVFLASWFGVSWLRLADQRSDLLRTIPPIALTVAGVAIGYQMFRWFYFHDVFANTYYVKLLGKSGEVFDACYWGSWGYVKGFARWLRPLIYYAAPSLWVASALALFVVAVRWSRGPWSAGEFPAGAPALWPSATAALATALLTAYVCVVGGDWMPGSRYIMHFAPVFLALGYGTFVAFCLATEGRSALARWGWVAAYAVLVGIGIGLLDKREASVLHELAKASAESRLPKNHGYSILRGSLSREQLLGIYNGFLTRFADRLKPGDTVAFYEAGSPALRLGDRIRFIDLSGLNDRTMAQAKEGAAREGVKSLCLNYFYLPDERVRGPRDRYLLSSNAKAIVFDRYVTNVQERLPTTILGGNYVLLAGDKWSGGFAIYWRRDALPELARVEHARGLQAWLPVTPDL
jgi:hypothetical protein